MKSKLTRASYRRFAGITASLPKKVYDLGIEDYFDNEVLEKNILLPRKERLSEVYANIATLFLAALRASIHPNRAT